MNLANDFILSVSRSGGGAVVLEESFFGYFGNSSWKTVSENRWSEPKLWKGCARERALITQKQSQFLSRHELLEGDRIGVLSQRGL